MSKLQGDRQLTPAETDEARAAWMRGKYLLRTEFGRAYGLGETEMARVLRGLRKRAPEVEAAAARRRSALSRTGGKNTRQRYGTGGW